MRTKEIISASCFAMMTLASIFILGFTACSSDDEPSIDEILSDKTTTIAVELSDGEFKLFDYAGSNYVKSDTFRLYYRGSSSKMTVDVELRQGKHHLIWFETSHDDDYYLTFDPKTKTVELFGDDGWPQYAEYDYEVTEYLTPAHKPVFAPLGGEVKFEVTDCSERVEVPLNSWYPRSSKTITIGKLKGYPIASEVSLHGNGYKASGSIDFDIDATSGYDYANQKVTKVTIGTYGAARLLPEDGIDNIQLTAEVFDNDGNPIPTTQLPKFSVKRGHVTTLRGPLFSGTTADWEVTMEPYAK